MDQSEPNHKTAQFIAGFLGSAILALFCAFVIAALAAGGIISMSLVKIFLGLAWIVAALSMVLSLVFLSSPPRRTKSWVSGMAIVLMAVGLIWLDRWIERNGPDEAGSRSALVEALVARLSPLFNTKVQSTSSPPHTPTHQPTPDPEVVLIAPVTPPPYIFTWVPEVDITPRITPTGPAGYPVLELRKLSDASIVGVGLVWSVDGPPIETVFLSSPRLTKYKPTVKDGMYWINNADGKGAGLPAADRDETNLPYVGSEPVKVQIPATIWHSFVLRLITNQKRPSNASSTENGFVKNSATVAMVSVKYRQGTRSYTRRFRIITAITAIADDSVLTGSSIESIPRSLWSQDNLRAVIRWSCIRY